MRGNPFVGAEFEIVSEFYCPQLARFTGEPHADKGQRTCPLCRVSWCDFCDVAPCHCKPVSQ